MTYALPLIVLVALLAYFIYSLWNAYSTGCNHGMLKKNQVKGIIRYGPYLSLTISFFGVMIVVFLIYELIGYYTGFIRLDLPAALANLDFFTFLIKQFSSVRLHYPIYMAFLGTGLALSAILSYLVVTSLYRMGLHKISGKPLKKRPQAKG